MLNLTGEGVKTLSFSKGVVMLRDDAIRAGKIKPTKEDRERMGLDPVKPGPKPKEEKETDIERMTKPIK